MPLSNRRSPLLSLMLLTLASSASLPEKDTKVLILGAGAAGLSAARTLTEHNVTDFIILEGSGRIGGRAASVKLGDKTVEAGANWLVGLTKGFPLWDIVQKYDIQGKMSDWDSVTVRDADGRNKTEDYNNAYDKLDSKLSGIDDIVASIKMGTSDMSLRSCFDIINWKPKSLMETMVEVFDYDFEIGNIPDVASCSADQVSNAVTEDQFYVFDARGFEFIIQKLAEDVLVSNDSRLYLNEVVTQINYTSSSVSVTTKSGKTFTADYVIVTFSVGVLKSYSVNFNPPLPVWKINNLFRLRLENYVSVFLKFPDSTTVFWDDTEFILYADERRNFYPVWQNLRADGILPRGSKVLQMVTMGEEADRVSGLTDEEIKAEVLSLLGRVYNSVAVPDPEDMYVTRWKTDPLYLGCFVSLEPGAFTPETIAAIGAPVGRIHFAGEAYDDLYFGYTTGTVRSGTNAAKAIRACMEGNCPETGSRSPHATQRPAQTCVGTTLNISWLFLYFHLSLLQVVMK